MFTPLSTWAAAQILFVSISLAPFSAPVKKDIWEMDGLAKVSSGSTLPCAYFERLVYEPLYGHTYQIIKPMTVWFKCIGSTVTHFSTVIKNHNWSNCQQSVIPWVLVLVPESRKTRAENAQTADSKMDLVSITSRCSEFEPALGNSVTAETDNTYYSRMI